ncbi:acetylornithine carbamoyltransferase [Aquirufa ecclesiirivi]|uniref:N-succinylornithine carbamoyltransferase n=1 Tax=Aquirufa ecclesiirivi TaxID=2715124 RepID=A0ABT4JIS1_9BACT|nr:acetylornithine carbamoyltransferase [Aquirufa ecclesiirivi]MCZ2475466.1 acetylornithine carbamoyltransferase [Aquirufa ecclesiirivi]MDF0694268.1 acetylornithine carbamoyltransferase [Aquirufa ecclesiirivi]NHC48776.1 acetylornithine carbamoyltransferase [Aquirufa ecclesiirivi]
MHHFTSIHDAYNIPQLVNEALLMKRAPYSDCFIGKNKTIGLLFFNSSLRTRLSTQKAAQNLGMNVMVMNVGADSWQLEMNEGVIMNGDKAEHVSEAAAVIGQYCDIVGLRSFPSLVNREDDYSELVLNQFMKYTGRPILSLESATRHPLQSLTDLITIQEYKKTARPKVVLTWAPHVKALPQCVPNSFAEWMNHSEVDFTIAHPKGYELAPEFSGNANISYDPKEAFEGADFIYAKNWSSYEDYGKILNSDPTWMVTMDKMKMTNNAKFMHCLPVRRNVVVEDAVLDSEHSIVVQQAGNRVWAAQTVLKEMLLSLAKKESPYLF